MAGTTWVLKDYWNPFGKQWPACNHWLPPPGPGERKHEEANLKLGGRVQLLPLFDDVVPVNTAELHSDLADDFMFGKPVEVEHLHHSCGLHEGRLGQLGTNHTFSSTQTRLLTHTFRAQSSKSCKHSWAGEPSCGWGLHWACAGPVLGLSWAGAGPALGLSWAWAGPVLDLRWAWAGPAGVTVG